MIACKAHFSCTTSRGDTRPTATLDMMRSKSPMRCSWSSMVWRNSGSRKNIHHVEPLVDRFLVFQGEHHPSFQHSSAHRRHCAVDDLQQRSAVFLHRLKQFQGTDGELVQSYIPLFLDAESDVICPICVCWVSSRYCMMAPAAMMPLRRCSTPKPFGFLVPKCFSSRWRAVCSVNAVVHLEHAISGAEIFLEISFAGTVVEHFLGRKVAQQFLHIVGVPSPVRIHPWKYPGRDAASQSSEMHGSQEVVFPCSSARCRSSPRPVSPVP